jgi:nitroreductase / dihydropteridine reductase
MLVEKCFYGFNNSVMDLIKLLQWRYATKRMNGQKVPQDKIDRILHAISLSASSLGMQPYTIFVIKNKELLEKIKPIADDQPQILECSHLLVFAAWDKLTVERVEMWANNIIETRGELHPRNVRQKSSLLKRIVNNSPEVNHTWCAKQVYLALGTALIAAANEQVDSTPMEGFKAGELDELLQLPQKGLRSIVLLTLGYRDEVNDFLLPMKKVRRNIEKLFIEL